ncbi:DUF5954 family protein [Streptomyces sp. NPDC015492]|uniref:DUF5954 family protein n=1 Tax=Streptomyces sp. NPDC015492 TaxID=3364958 RepID=UPI0037032717
MTVTLGQRIRGCDQVARKVTLAAHAADGSTVALRAGRVDEVEAGGTVYRIARCRSLLRRGSDGPEGPRPSDINTHAPEAPHPRLDEDGTVHFEERAADEAAS